MVKLQAPVNRWVCFHWDPESLGSLALLLPLTLAVRFFFFFFGFLGLHMWHMEDPRLGVKLELQLLPYTTATAMPDLSHICDLHNSSWQCQILNLLNKARDQTHTFMDNSWVYNPLSHNGNS